MIGNKMEWTGIKQVKSNKIVENGIKYHIME